MRLKPVASVVLSCLGFSSPLVFAEDVMVVTASGYEKKITQCRRQRLCYFAARVTNQ
ncbi:bifunctional enterobactin receptor/adhesin protein [Citrobacter freundii]|nr:bifunctional enterobactin receptor/adhesin protein [Citrobacter freundii]